MCTSSSSSTEATFGLHRTAYTGAFPGNPALECLNEGSIMFNGIKGQAWNMLFIWIRKRSIFFYWMCDLCPPCHSGRIMKYNIWGWNNSPAGFNPAFPQPYLLYFTITLVLSSDRSHGNLWSGGGWCPLPAAISQPSCSRCPDEFENPSILTDLLFKFRYKK